MYADLHTGVYVHTAQQLTKQLHQNTALRRISCWGRGGSRVNCSVNPLFYGIQRFITAFPEIYNGIVSRSKRIESINLPPYFFDPFYIILSPTSKCLKWPFPSCQVRSQTMNTEGGAASTASAHMYILWCMYAMLYYTYTVYTVCTHKRTKRLYRDHTKSTL